MSESLALKTRSEERLRKFESLTESLPAKRAEVRGDFVRDGERERDKIEAAAQAAAAKLERETVRTLEQEVVKARETVRDEVVERALALATERLTKRLTPAAHRALIRGYIADLEALESLGGFRG